MGEKEELLAKGFNLIQTEEIEKGLAAGIDVSIYAKKEFFAIQMRQIRKGLMAGLPVEVYAKPEYDWFQMEEIREGLQAKIDISKYASPQIDYRNMRQIRKGLSVGIDLSNYWKMDPDILRQLRKAVVSKVNIAEYIKQGYSAEQIEQIRLALEKELDIRPYLSKELIGASIREISEGLEQKIDVAVYAKKEYSWRQMREIRLGLEHRIDIWNYSNLLYDWQQMREIRLGLEDGLNVEQYRSLMYTWREMERRRKKLQENRVLELIGEKSGARCLESPENLQITISEDEMRVYIKITNNRKQWDAEEIKEILWDRGIRRGILKSGLDKLISGKWMNQEILVAEGKEPEQGKDGWYEYFFRIRPEHTPRVLEDGSVDYQNTDWFEVVERGQKIAYYHEAENGFWGYTVFGRELAPKKGREKVTLKGKGFILLPDRKTYVATESGRIELHEDRLDISKLIVLEEVTQATGNVEFDGNIFVKGNVGSGTHLKATGDIQVNGFVESAVIEAGGNILLRQGVNAAREGYIKAGKSVCGQFFETTSVYAGADIQANYCLNCELEANGSVRVSGLSGTLAGGIVHAAKGLLACNLGNRVGIVTTVSIGVNDSVLKRKQHLEECVKEVHEELRILGKAHVDFQRKYAPEVYNGMEIYQKIEKAIYTKEKEMEMLYKEKQQLEEEIVAMKQAKVVVQGTLHEGVVVEIGKERWKASEVNDVTIKWANNRVAVYSNR